MGKDDRGPEPGENPKEEHDRQLIELLNELRVALPGVQVLFAFLLAVPFAQGWRRVTPFQKHVFFIALMATALSSVLMIAPSAYHRLVWRHEEKETIVDMSHRLFVAGLIVLGVAICSAVLLVSDYIFNLPTAIVTTACLSVALVWLWYGLALRSRVRNRRR